MLSIGMVALSPGAREEEVIARRDELLERYGGRGAHGRQEHLSPVSLAQPPASNRRVS